jgi:hypothetical protein
MSLLDLSGQTRSGGATPSWTDTTETSVLKLKFTLVGERQIRNTGSLFSMTCWSQNSAARCDELLRQDTRAESAPNSSAQIEVGLVCDGGPRGRRSTASPICSNMQAISLRRGCPQAPRRRCADQTWRRCDIEGPVLAFSRAGVLGDCRGHRSARWTRAEDIPAAFRVCGRHETERVSAEASGDPSPGNVGILAHACAPIEGAATRFSCPIGVRLTDCQLSNVYRSNAAIPRPARPGRRCNVRILRIAPETGQTAYHPLS